MLLTHLNLRIIISILAVAHKLIACYLHERAWLRSCHSGTCIIPKMLYKNNHLFCWRHKWEMISLIKFEKWFFLLVLLIAKLFLSVFFFLLVFASNIFFSKVALLLIEFQCYKGTILFFLNKIYIILQNFDFLLAMTVFFI